MAGPRQRLQLAGTPVAGLIAWVPATGPVGLGFSAVSYAGQLTVGVPSDASLVPDHDRLVALIDAEISALARPDCQVLADLLGERHRRRLHRGRRLAWR